MDKILGLFTALFVGIPLIIISMLICWGMDDERCNNKQSGTDLDMRFYVPSWDRDRRGRNGHDLQNGGR